MLFVQNFGSIIRGYIVAPRLNDSLFMAADWFENYQKRRVSMYTNWKLRGGICCASEARECFDWKNKTKWQEFLVAIAKIRVENEGCCVLSELEEEMKSQLRWSWIQKWMKDGNKTILVGTGEIRCDQTFFYAFYDIFLLSQVSCSRMIQQSDPFISVRMEKMQAFVIYFEYFIPESPEIHASQPLCARNVDPVGAQILQKMETMPHLHLTTYLTDLEAEQLGAGFLRLQASE
jgi:hypothetical protein